MVIQWIFAAFHLLALGIGLGAIWWRGRSLKGELDPEGIRRVLFSDNLWGVAALLWIGTGLVRAFGGLEKGSAYYLANNLFWFKMSLLALILLLEVWPASTWIRWRIRLARGEAIQIDGPRMNLFAAISYLQAALIVLMIFAATGMARGISF